MARIICKTFTLSHPVTGNVVDFIIDPSAPKHDGGYACIMDNDEPESAGFCDWWTARDFWKQLTAKGYRRSA